MIKLYNTLHRAKEDFKPIDPNMVKIYSCGPTVYSTQHIGNMRSAFFTDLLKSVVRYIGGYNVKHVINITDVGHLTGDNEGDADHGEDRMEKGARKDGITARDVAAKYTDQYLKDLEIMGIEKFQFVKPNEYHTNDKSENLMPRATDHIQQQIDMVLDLEKGGYTYIIEGDGVYMDTSKISDYGVLTNQKNLDGIEAGARVEDSGKKNPTDFALWKFNITGKKRDMERESPRGIGFPGRHIECSAMSREYLGDYFDIHTGGMEHIAIHHTNEIAQSECSGCHKPRVNYRVHNQWLMMNGKKLAKSDGNVAFVSDILGKGYTGQDFRMFLLNAHYRSFQDFTREGMEMARKRRENLKKNIYKFCQENNISAFDNNKPDSLETNPGAIYLADDLNTTASLAEFSTLTLDNIYALHYLDKYIYKLWLFDFSDLENGNNLTIPDDVSGIAASRRQAKLDKNRALADELRNKLTELGRNMKDGKDSYEMEKIS